jgi:hypothetical protein
MAFSNIEDLINHISTFEVTLTAHYAAIRDQSENNGVRLLTYYLSRHRNHLMKAIDDFDKNSIERIKKIKIKYEIDQNLGKNFPILDKDPKDIKSEELLDSAVQYDMEIITLYKKLNEQPITKEAKSFFEICIKLEEKDVVMIKKMIATNYF